MVDKSNIAFANQLLNEANTIVRAISNIDGGGPITSMVIGVGAGAGADAVPAQVVTTYMTAPPEMYAVIRGLLIARQQQINNELAGLGVNIY